MTFGTLIELLRYRAIEQPESLAYTHLVDGEKEGKHLTYREFDIEARAIGATLQQYNKFGGRALMLYPSSLEFISAFFGCLYAGVIGVPAYPPEPGRLNRSLPRLQAILQDAQPNFVLTTAEILRMASKMIEQNPALQALEWIATDEIGLELAKDWQEPKIYGEHLAFLQYTSGSTSTPKGVMVSHENLLHNLECIKQGFKSSMGEPTVTWLPNFHDMGLIEGILQPLYTSYPCYLMPPMAFLQRPYVWLQAISHYRAVKSGAPNFAYELCVSKVKPEERDRLDLSSWKVAYCGAEPNRRDTMERFENYFKVCGFNRSAFSPGYGLAEGTLMVSSRRRGSGPYFGIIDEEKLEKENQVELINEGRTLVSCGEPSLDIKVAIVNPYSLKECKEGEVGEIWTASKSVAQGYWRRAEATKEIFQAYIADTAAGPFLRTGDLGFMLGKELFITGRFKDLIIIRGRNYYPQDLEMTADRSHALVRLGCCAAFSVEVDGQEVLSIAAEVKRIDRELTPEELAEISDAIRNNVATQHQVEVYGILLLKQGTVPKTSSGKIQRHGAKIAFLAGTPDALMVNKLATVESQSRPRLTREDLQALASGERRKRLVTYLQESIAAGAKVRGTFLSSEQALNSIGLDSLVAVEIKNRIENDLGVSLSLTQFLQDKSIADLADDLLTQIAAPETRQKLQPRQRLREEVALSYGQQALWFINQLAPDSGAYNVFFAARIKATCKLESLAKSLELLAARHAILRTFYQDHNGVPRQIIKPEVTIDFQVVDTTDWTSTEINQQVTEVAHEAFDLGKDLGWRVRLFSPETKGVIDDGILVFVFHHINVDFWSITVLLRDLGLIYGQVTGGQEVHLPPVIFEYWDYVDWQSELLASKRGEEISQYWQQQLAGELPLSNLPTDRARPTVASYQGKTYVVQTNKKVQAGVHELARRYKTTIYTVLLTVFQTLLYRYSGQSDIIVGSPAAGRSRPEFAELVGYFINPVPLRTQVTADVGFNRLLLQVRRNVLGALEYQDYPFPLLVEKLQVKRQGSENPIFQVAFVLEKPFYLETEGISAFVLGQDGAELQLGELKLASVNIEKQFAQFDLTLYAVDLGESLGFAFEYSTDLFDASTVQRIAASYVTLLTSVVANPEEQVGRLPILAETDREQILTAWNRTTFVYPDKQTLTALLEAQMAATPQNIAVECGEKTLTYQALNIEANKVAHYLRHLGVNRQDVVGVYIERSLEMLIGIIGILKAGGAYLPIDISYPQDRVSFMLQDAAVKVVLTSSNVRDQLGTIAATAICLDTDKEYLAQSTANPESVNYPDDVVYVIYTSGSTGRPKGVQVHHRGLVNYLDWTIKEYQLTTGIGAIVCSSISFDITGTPLYCPLLCGQRVILPVAGDGDGLSQIAEAIKRSRDLSFIMLTPSHLTILQQLLAETDLTGRIRTLFTIGEALFVEDVAYWQEKAPEMLFVNMYGPTEATVGCTVYDVKDLSTLTSRSVPIGRPMGNTQMYVLDSYLSPLPIGVVGELYIGGVQVAYGYLNRPELTAERFLPDPFLKEPGAKIYRTGDLARYLPDGNIEYLGRIDDQVKIHGYRIELGEIGAVISQYQNVRESVVVVKTVRDDKRLVAYLVVTQQIAIAELKQYLKQQLPDYMVPTAYVVLDSIPLTPNGKVDRKALPDPDASSYEQRQYQPPRNEIERKVVDIYSKILAVGQIGIDDNFFELGGHSLLATQVVSHIRAELGVDIALRTIFEHPTVAALAVAVSETESSSQLAITKIDRNQTLPLSFAQERMWFLSKLMPKSVFYNIPLIFDWQGALDLIRLEASFQAIIDRHEALRTTIVTVAGRPQPIIHPELKLEIPLVDLTGLDLALRENEAYQLAGKEISREFDLEKLPLMRVKVLRLTPETYWLIITMHHAVSDGWSLGVLLKEVQYCYQRLCQDKPIVWTPLAIQYVDFAYWQRTWLQGEVLAQQLNYWREQLKGSENLLLPTDYARPAVSRYQGKHFLLQIEPGVVEKLRSLAQQQEATLFMVMLGAFYVLLQRYTGQNDINVGTPIANRNQYQVEGLIGFFVNTLVMRLQLTEQTTFNALLAQIKQTALAAYANQDVPFEKLVEVLQPERQMNRSPLFQVMFVLDNNPLEWDLAGLKIAPVDVELAIAKFDLTISFREWQGKLAGWIEYDTDLFTEATIVRIAQHYRKLLQSILADPSQPIGRLAMLAASERQQLLEEWNQTAAPYPNLSVTELLEAQIAATPQNIAVECREKTLTYQELNIAANKVAHYLRALGVKPQQIVGIYLDRSLEMVIAILAVLKAGGAYLPIDISYPQERVDFMLQDAAVQAVLTRSSLSAQLGQNTAKVICLDTDEAILTSEQIVNPTIVNRPADLVYLIYTSGSTGRPKGVMIEHQGLVNYLTWAVDYYRVAEAQGAPLHSSISFDLTVTSFYTPLLTGKQIVLLPEAETIDVLQQLATMLSTRNFSTLKITPAHLNVLRELLATTKIHTGPQVIVIGGEALYGEDLVYWQQQLPDTRLINEYGPTETVVGCVVYEATTKSTGSLPIGRPIANTAIYILNTQLEPLPVGVIGEVYIGGDGVARGYLNREDLTAERFLPDPFRQQPAKMYKTGDLARYLPDGNIEYVGRIDDQVKLRGYRIELGEIAATINQYSGIQESVVVVNSGPEKQLIAYLVASPELSIAELRSYLKQQLPEYMLPVAYVKLASIPLTPNGKVDRKALPDVEQGDYARREYVAPNSFMEKKLAEIYCEVLKVKQIGIADNFFELGGHSLLATQVISRLRTELALDVQLRWIFEFPQLGQLAAELEHLHSNLSQSPILPIGREKPLPLSFAQERLWFLDQLTPDSPFYNLPAVLRVQGDLDQEILRASFQIVVDRHEILRTTFKLVDGRPTQIVETKLKVTIPIVDLTSIAASNRESEALQLVSVETHQSFELSTLPLMRVKLLQLAAQEYWLIITLHHIISDGWSGNVLLTELRQIYTTLKQTAAYQAAPLPIQYADFAYWQRQWLQGEVLEQQLNYWREKLRGVEMLELPTDRPRPTTSRFQGRHYSLSLDAKLVNELRQLSIKQDTTLFMTLLAAFEVLLQRYSRQNDISVGTPIANRTRQEVENLIGFFVNTLVMRANVQGEQRFVDFLAQVKTTALEAYANQDVPFEKLVEALQPQRQLNRSPLFQVMFVMGNMATDTVSWDGVTLTPQAVELTIAKFDLTLFAQEIPTGLLTLWEYDTDLFDQETVARIAAQYEILLHSIVANPQELVGRLSLLTEAERQKILIQWNQTTAAYPQDQCLPELLEAQVARTPDAVAVEYEGQTLTYTELNQRANKVAFYLREISVGPESLVALSLERCLDLVVGIVGILKAGAAYLPIDPTYPVDRIKFMLEDAAVSVLVTNQQQDTVLPKLDGLVRIRLDQDWEVINCRSGENPPLTANPDNLAYVIYTSGSTGRPKGAMIHHRGLMNYLTWAIDFYQVADGEGSPLHSSISFDLTITSLFPALLTGKRVVLTKESEGIEGLQQLARSLREHQNLSLLKITPAHLNVMRQLLAPEAAPNRTRVMVIGGEALYAEELAYWREHAPNTRLINEYGPTETVVGCCVYEVPQQEALRPGGVLIGRPIANTTLYILNEQLEPMPIGVPGELYIGGDGVARGYLNRPELTAERFLANPFSANSEAKIYRTGDLARYLPDGNIEYIGRIDDQVKVRGYRIELGEVEAVLNQHPAVRKGLVMIKDDIQEGKRLVAYVTAHFMLDRIPWQASCLLELENGEKIRLLTEDISDSGACLTGVETFLRKNERAKLILALPEEETFIINGIIAWQHGKRTGVKFDVTSDEIKQLRRTIEKINKQQGFSVYDFRLFQRADTRLPMNVPCMVEFNDGQTVSANTQNISSSGLGLVNLPLGNKIAGQMVRVQVFLPGMGEYIWLNGKVAWQISDRCGLMIKPTSAERMLIHQTMDYIASSTGFSITHLRDFLKNKLPAYMVPAAFIVLDTLPLTQNGKLDRSALAAAEWIRPELDKPFSAPRNSIEERLARIFGEVLNLEKVSIHDNFFEIGGHSILVTQLIARIHEVFPVTLPVRQFFETPTVAGIADLLDVVCWLGQEYDTEKPKVESLDLYKEAVLEPIISGENVGFTTAQPGNIFLAGATGFLGSFILWELLRQTESTVYCLVASAGPEEGKEKIQREMENYELWNGRLSNRIIAIPGSFSQPKFGLLDEQFNILSTLIDTIYYAGASVNYVAPYSIMKEINVIGVQEVLRLASQFKLKPVHYVSSISVFSASDFTANSEVSEYDEPNFPQELTTGYAQSRWVAEKLVVAARQRKIPVSLYRQGRITGDSQTGIASVDDVIFRLIKGFIQLQSAPILNNLIVEMVPVDYTAKALVHLSRQTDLIGKNFHLTNANCIKYLDLVGWMRAYGYNLELIPAEKWLNQAKMRTTVDDPLYPILSVLDTIVADTKPWKINCEQTQQLLKNLSVECPSVDDSLLRTYFGYLIQSGFLTKPHS